jgi:hypothetical protein
MSIFDSMFSKDIPFDMYTNIEKIKLEMREEFSSIYSKNEAYYTQEMIKLYRVIEQKDQNVQTLLLMLQKTTEIAHQLQIDKINLLKNIDIMLSKQNGISQ